MAAGNRFPTYEILEVQRGSDEKANPRSKTDVWLRNMLRQFRAGRGFGEAFNNVGTDSGALAAVGSGAASLLGFASNWLRIAQLVEIVRYAAFPLMGYLLAILYVAFPFVLAAGLLPGGVGRLVTYFALVASVKAWPSAGPWSTRCTGTCCPRSGRSWIGA